LVLRNQRGLNDCSQPGTLQWSEIVLHEDIYCELKEAALSRTAV
jgi:hypothetical protein